MLLRPFKHHATSEFYDSLWEVRPTLQPFINQCTTTAVPVGAVALDECSVCCNHKLAKKSFNKSKRDKFAVRMYAIVGYKFKYIYLLWETKKGSSNFQSQVKRFLSYFPRVEPTVKYYVCNNRSIPTDSASSLWVSMVCLLYTDAVNVF